MGDSLYFDYSLPIKNYWFYDFIKPILKILSHFVYKLHCKGIENLPVEGPLIIACNHISFSDPALIIANYNGKIHYMAKSELFEKPLFSALLRYMNAFPVRRNTGDRQSLRYARKILENGGILGIFPEGRRVKNSDESVNAKSGTGLLVKYTGADVLPCCIYKTDKKFRSEVTLVFGNVINNTELLSEKTNFGKTNLDISDYIMDRIKELWQQEKELKQQKPQDSVSE